MSINPIHQKLVYWVFLLIPNLATMSLQKCALFQRQTRKEDPQTWVQIILSYNFEYPDFFLAPLSLCIFCPKLT